MKHCVHGLGFTNVCNARATTTRESWPLCETHAKLWDSFDVYADALPEDVEPDFVNYMLHEVPD